MPIKFSGNLDTLLNEARLTLKQYNDLFDGGDFIYSHMNNGSGICPECAPWLGTRTTGDGSDGVPVPPLHPRCKCFLMPYAASVLSDILRGRNAAGELELWKDHFQWLESLPPDRLSSVIGKVRTRIIVKGELKIEDLYEGQTLKTLHDLGYDKSGNKIIKGKISVDDVFSDPQMKELMTAIHADQFESLPQRLRGVRPGDYRAVRRMIIYSIVRMDKGATSPSWLVLVIELLRAFLQGDVPESRQDP